MVMERGAEDAGDNTVMGGVKRRGHPSRSPLPADGEASGSDRNSVLLAPLLGEHEAGKGSHSSKAAVIVLGLVFLEVVAFYGVYLNLVVYLQDVLHGDSASNAAAVNFWAAASYLMPVIGVAVADSLWGKYKTVLVGLSTAFVGMALITISASVPSLTPPPCEQQSTHCSQATLGQRLVFSTGIYLTAVGVGAAKAAIASFRAEQFDDGDAAEREQKASYFSWYYGVGNLGILTSGTLLVWVEERVSWALGFGVCAAFLALAVVGLAVSAPVYRMVPPAGSPLKGVFQVLVAFARKVNVRAPDDSAELYEEEEERVKATMSSLGEEPVRKRLGHTNEFRWLDKAAVVTAADDVVEDGRRDAWRLCTVTQVEEVKTLLRLLPIWLTAAVYFVANSQAQTTFVQQGTMTDPTIALLGGMAISVPAASLTSVKTVFAVAAVALYNRAVAAEAAFTPLQLMGLGHAAGIVAVGLAAWAEARRLEAAADVGPVMSIGWLLPQYVAMAVSDAALGVGHLDFFYDQAPEAMKGTSTAFYFLSFSLGNLLSSQLVKLMAAVTGWFLPDMDERHLD